MNNQHVINSLELNIDFDNLHQGEGFQQQRVNFVKSRLLPVVDRVFNTFDKENEVISIDDLNIDLGDINHEDFYNQLEDKLERELTNQLTKKVEKHRLENTTTSNQAIKKQSQQEDTVSIMTPEQSQLSKLIVYLNSGTLPWNEKSSRLTSKNWLDEGVQLHLNDIAAHLNNADTQASKIAARLFYQLSSELLLQLISTLTLQAQQLFFPLLFNAASKNTTKPAKKIDIYNHPALDRAKTTWWKQKIEDGLQALPTTDLFIQWPELITKQALLFVQAIRNHGQQTSARHIMVNAFSETQLHDVLTLLEPTEHAFINELFNVSSLSNNIDLLNKKNKKQNIKNEEARQAITHNVRLSQQHLWLFTFDYLLIERGSVFNRKSYLRNVLKKMAAHHNSDEITLLKTISLSLSALSYCSILGEQMLDFIQELSSSIEKPTIHKANHSHDIKSRDVVKITQQLTQLLTGGSSDDIKLQWPNIIKNHHEILQQLITKLGQQQSVLRHIAHQFTDVILLDIVLLLAPSAHQYIKQLLPYSSFILPLDKTSSKKLLMCANKPKSIAITGSSPYSKALLWEFTLSYLITERGSEFNRSRYMVSVIKQMASHHNLGYDLLLQDLYSHINQIENTKELQPLQQLLLSLLLQSPSKKLSTQSKLTEAAINNIQIKQLSITAQQSVLAIGLLDSTNSNNPEQWLTNFVTALTKADNHTLHTWWQSLIQTQPQLLQELLVLHGKNKHIRHNWANNLPNKTLIDIVILVAPHHSQYIIDTIDNGTLLNNVLINSLNDDSNKTENSVDKVRVIQNIWTFSLHYLLVERGGEFNKKNYLISVLRQLAAHHNLDYRLMMQVVLNVVTATKHSQNQITLLLHEIATESTNDITKVVETIQPKTSSLIDDFDDYQRLSALLGLNEYINQSKPVNSIFTSLKNNNPLLLIRLIKQALASHSSWLTLTSQLAQNNLTYLLQQLMTLTYVDSFLSTTSNIVNASNALALINQHIKKLTTLTQQQYFIAKLIELFSAGGLNNGQPINLNELLNTAKSVKKIPPHAISHNNKKGDSETPTENEESQSQLTSQPAQSVIQHYLLKLSTNDAISSLLIKQLITAIERLLIDNPKALEQLIERFMQSSRLSSHLLKHLPESLLIKLLWSINRSRYQAIASYAEYLTQLTSNFIEKYNTKDIPTLTESTLYHQYHYIFQYLIGHKKNSNSDDFINDYCHYLNGVFNQKLLSELPVILAEEHTSVSKSMRDKVIQSMSITDKAATNNIPEKSTLRDEPHNMLDHTQETDTSKFRFPEEESQDRDPIYINNAGLVLLGSYIPRLFTMLSLTEEGAFKTKDDAHKAVHLLQYIVNGATKTPEHELAFNKVLCGLPLSEPVPIEMELTNEEKEIISGLLVAVIQHWSVLGNTSAKAFQETFLERKASLWNDEEQWQVEVVEQSFDMLLDQLPWSYSLIKYPWMEQPLYVTWR